MLSPSGFGESIVHFCNESKITTMKEKFKNISTDEGTTVLSRKEIKIEDLDAVHEKWKWDGIAVESIILFNEDVIAFDEVRITDLVKSSLNIGGEVTYSQTNEYTFINFNFKH